MLVKWNGLGLLGVNGVDAKTVVLKPGFNDHVTDADWDVISKHPLVQERLENGSLEVIGSPKKPDASPVEIFCGMKTGAARKAASETIDLPLLKAWLKAETRTEIQKAIKEQIAAIEAPPVYRDNNKKSSK